MSSTVTSTKQVAKTLDMPNTKKNPHLSRRAATRDNMVCCLCHQDCYLSSVICCSCFDRSKRVAARNEHEIFSSRAYANVRKSTMAGEDDNPSNANLPNHFLCLSCALLRADEALRSAPQCAHHMDKLCLMTRFNDERLEELLKFAHDPTKPLPTSPVSAGRRRSGGRKST